MTVKLPLIVGFGGYNAAGRSSGYQSYNRMIFESLDTSAKAETLSSLANLMGLQEWQDDDVLNGTLIRKIEASYFDVDAVHSTKKMQLAYDESRPISFEISARSLPSQIPSHWLMQPLDEEARSYRVTLQDNQNIKIDATASMAVKAAGQLPTGFNPASFYRSQHHPRGLQLAVLGASDAVHSMGLSWQSIIEKISPDDVAVYSSSVMSQLDNTGFGGMLNSRMNSARVTSKQLALGLNTMPADFINAYVLGSVGTTGAVTGACATFLYNLRQGAEDIRSGKKKVVIVGSSEAPIIPEIIDGYMAMSALATDAELANLDRATQPDYRRASRPFGANCGFTLAESSQYTILMADDLAVELGAQVFGAVPGVYVNADGYKKSISAPGAGNYITMAKAVGLAKTLLGHDVVKHKSFVQAHGSSTPQNRVTESKIFDQVAQAFDINQWPVAAVKAYVGHSLGPASGDQLTASLGVFQKGILPGIKTIDETAGDVYADRLSISRQDQALGVENCQVAFLNSKGFGGNNATAMVISPDAVDRYLAKKYSASSLSEYRSKGEETQRNAEAYLNKANSGDLNAIYEFGNNLIDEDNINIDQQEMSIPGYKNAISLSQSEGFDSF